MNQLGCVGSGNKLQRERKGPWGLGERKAKLMCLQEGRRGRRRERRERHRHVPGAGGSSCWVFRQEGFRHGVVLGEDRNSSALC